MTRDEKIAEILEIAKALYPQALKEKPALRVLCETLDEFADLEEAETILREFAHASEFFTVPEFLKFVRDRTERIRRATNADDARRRAQGESEAAKRNYDFLLMQREPLRRDREMAKSIVDEIPPDELGRLVAAVIDAEPDEFWKGYLSRRDPRESFELQRRICRLVRPGILEAVP